MNKKKLSLFFFVLFISVIKSYAKVSVFHNNTIKPIFKSVSPDGGHIAVSGDWYVKIWDSKGNLTGEYFDIEVEVTEQRVVKQGMEFDFTISIIIDEILVWQSISTWLTRGKFGKEFESTPLADILKTETKAEHFVDLYIPRDIGKKFAKITLDYNPIHISKTLAPLFGLKRDVAHAMWATAQALGKMDSLLYDKPIRIDLAFKGPLFLDNKSHIKTIQKKQDLHFDYYCGKNDRPSINGKVFNINHGETLI